VRVVETADAETTGNFDVLVNGVLVHSKKRGDGFLDEDDKLDRVFDAINAAIAGDAAYAAADEESGAGADAGVSGDASKKASSSSPLLPGASKEMGDPTQDAAQRRSMIVSICTLLISIPALIGA